LVGFTVGHAPSDVLRNTVLPEGSFLHLGEIRLFSLSIIEWNILQGFVFDLLWKLATSLGQTDIVRALLNAGADPSTENKQEENAFELCQSESMQQIFVGELLRATARSEYVHL